MGEGDIANAEGMELSEGSERILELMATFDAQDTRYLSTPDGSADLGSAGGEGESLRVQVRGTGNIYRKWRRTSGYLSMRAIATSICSSVSLYGGRGVSMEVWRARVYRHTEQRR